MNAHFVYQLIDSYGEVIYVGCSGDPMGRLRRHRKRPWGYRISDVLLRPCRDEATARAIEGDFIERFRPQYNIVGNPAAPGTVPGSRKDMVIEALRDAGPMTQTECEQYLRARGVDNVKSFVGTTLVRLRTGGVIEAVAEVPAVSGRWATANVYGLASTEVAA